MELFHIIDDGVAIIRVRGQVFKQVKIYRRGAFVYVPHAGGYIRLLRGAGTTVPAVSWLEVEGPNVTVVNGLPVYTEPKPVRRAA